MLTHTGAFLLMVPSACVALWHIGCWLGGRKKSPAPENTTSHPTVSILVPTRADPPELLGRVVESVASIVWPRHKLELIVVSDDPPHRAQEIRAVVQSTSAQLGLRSRVIVRESPEGKRCGALNEAFRASQGEYIMLLDMDNRPHPLTLSAAANYLRQGDAACVSRWQPYSYRRTRVSEALESSTDFLGDSVHKGRAALNLFVFPVSGVVYRRDVLETLGLWDVNVVQDDMWMGVKLISSGFTVAFSDQTPVQVLNPHTYLAFKVQQSKWAYGVSDVIRRGALRILRAHKTNLLKRAEALLYLCQQLSLSCTLAGTLLLSLVSLFSGQDVMAPLWPALVIWWVLNTAEASTFLSSQLERGKSTWSSVVQLGRNLAMAFALVPSLMAMGIAGFLGAKVRYRITPKGEQELEGASIRELGGETLMFCLLLALGMALVLTGAQLSASIVLYTAIPFAFVLLRFGRRKSSS